MSKAVDAIPEALRSRYVNIEAIPWIQMSEKSFRKVLFDDPVSGRHTWLTRLLPGASIPFHEHPDIEQTYVIEGRLVDDEGECTAGNFVWRPGGSRHTAHAPDGCVFLAFFGKASKMLPAK